MSVILEKEMMVVGIDEHDHSFYALEWTIDRFFTPLASDPPFKLVIVHAKPPPSTATSLVGPAAAAAAGVITYVDADLKVIADRVVDKAKELCSLKLVKNVVVEVVEGDPRNVLFEAVKKHHASILVVGSHDYGAIKRAVLGSVSDYCAHHAHCTVMIVKMPKVKHLQ